MTASRRLPGVGLMRVGTVIAIMLAAGVTTAAPKAAAPPPAAPSKPPPTKADEAFDRGRTLMAEGKIPEACAAFEESLGLDYQLGTLYNLATCNEKRGKLATALVALQKVVADDKNEPRRAKAQELVAQLEVRVPSLQISLEPSIAGTHVTLDDSPLADLTAPVRVDLGSHIIVVTAPGRAEARRTIAVDAEGQVVPVTVELGAELAVVRAVAPPTTSKRIVVGKLATAGGAAVVVTGLVVGGVALRDWHRSQDDARTDTTLANEEVAHVRTLGNVSTALIIVGVVTVGTGLYLWRSGARSVRATGSVGPDHGQLGMLVTF
jgi:hypothetical protein